MFYKNFVDILEQKNKLFPKKIAFSFINENQEVKITYKELVFLSKKVAIEINNKVKKKNVRILIFNKPGINYVISIFACFYSGNIAVPLYIPNFKESNFSLEKFYLIVENSSPSVILTENKYLKDIKKFLYKLHNKIKRKIFCISIDNIKNANINNWINPNSSYNDIAILQYTSGSTSDPKGVILSNKNLLNNINAIINSYDMNNKYKDGKAIIWLPPYHDMGLIGGILTPILNSYSLILISPINFIRNPLIWLKLISKFGGTISGGPNFAYQLCAKKMLINPINDLNLSSWKVAFCGAEPINPEVMKNFIKIFQPYGFDRHAFKFCYGLAESTLMVTDFCNKNKKFNNIKFPYIKKFNFDFIRNKNDQIKEIEENKHGYEIVSSGSVISNHKIKIININTLKDLGNNKIGEIIISGASVSEGYWKDKKNTNNNFIYMKNKRWLKTGDLGFLHKNELFVTGRIKEILIIRGQNFYPQDIESVSQNSHNLFNFCSSAVFSIKKK